MGKLSSAVRSETVRKAIIKVLFIFSLLFILSFFGYLFTILSELTLVNRNNFGYLFAFGSIIPFALLYRAMKRESVYAYSDTLKMDELTKEEFPTVYDFYLAWYSLLAAICVAFAGFFLLF